MVGTRTSAAKAQQTRAETSKKFERITGLPKGARVRIGQTPGGHFNGQPGVVDCHHLGEVGVEIKGKVYYFRPAEVHRA